MAELNGTLTVQAETNVRSAVAITETENCPINAGTRVITDNDTFQSGAIRIEKWNACKLFIIFDETRPVKNASITVNGPSGNSKQKEQ